MPLQPGYGETPLSGDEIDALLAHVVDALGPPVSKADIFDLESAVLQDVAEGLITDVFNGDLTLDELLTDQFLRDLHRQLYGDIWTWAGRWRSLRNSAEFASKGAGTNSHMSLRGVLAPPASPLSPARTRALDGHLARLIESRVSGVLYKGRDPRLSCATRPWRSCMKRRRTGFGSPCRACTAGSTSNYATGTSRWLAGAVLSEVQANGTSSPKNAPPSSRRDSYDR